MLMCSTQNFPFLNRVTKRVVFQYWRSFTLQHWITMYLSRRVNDTVTDARSCGLHHLAIHDASHLVLAKRCHSLSLESSWERGRTNYYLFEARRNYVNFESSGRRMSKVGLPGCNVLKVGNNFPEDNTAGMKTSAAWTYLLVPTSLQLTRQQWQLGNWF